MDSSEFDNEDSTSVVRVLGNFSSKVKSVSSSNLRRSKNSRKLSFNDSSFLSMSPKSLKVSPSNFDESIHDKTNENQKLQLINMKSENLGLKALLQSQEVNHKRSIIDLESQISKLKNELRVEMNKCSDLQIQSKLFEKSVVLSRHSDPSPVIFKSPTLHRENESHRTLALEIKESDKDMERNLKHQIVELTHKYSTLEKKYNESCELRDVEEGKRERIGEYRSKFESLQILNEKYKAELNELRNELQQNKDAVIVRNALRDKLEKYSKLVPQVEALQRENTLLAQAMDNQELLKEKISNYESRLERLYEIEAEASKAKEDIVHLSKNLRRWEEIVGTWMGFSKCESGEKFVSYESLSSKIAEVQKNELLSKLTIAECNSVNGEIERTLASAQKEIGTMKTEIGLLTDKNAECTNLIRRFRRKLLLTSKERDSYRNVLDSYEKEITFTGSQIEKDRISCLESIVNDHKDVIDKLENQIQLSNGGGSSEAHEDKIQEMESLVNTYKVELEKINALYQDVHNQKTEYEYELDRRAMKGDYNPLNTKIIHFKNNPLREALDTHEGQLRKYLDENNKLRTRVKLLEEGQTKDLTFMVGGKIDEGLSSAEVLQLQESLKSSEIKLQRLMEASSKMATDFRELCSILTGYRIDALPKNQYRLKSLYAESPNDSLLFQKGPKDEILLLETSYSQNLTDLIDEHLNVQNSIPCFLSALTMNLFAKQTFEVPSSVLASSSNEDDLILID